jgi:hypothetical protein
MRTLTAISPERSDLYLDEYAEAMLMFINDDHLPPSPPPALEPSAVEQVPTSCFSTFTVYSPQGDQHSSLPQPCTTEKSPKQSLSAQQQVDDLVLGLVKLTVEEGARGTKHELVVQAHVHCA